MKQGSSFSSLYVPLIIVTAEVFIIGTLRCDSSLIFFATPLQYDMMIIGYIGF